MTPERFQGTESRSRKTRTVLIQSSQMVPSQTRTDRMTLFRIRTVPPREFGRGPSLNLRTVRRIALAMSRFWGTFRGGFRSHRIRTQNSTRNWCRGGLFSAACPLVTSGTYNPENVSDTSGRSVLPRRTTVSHANLVACLESTSSASEAA